jgi:hypothetical protein
MTLKNKIVVYTIAGLFAFGLGMVVADWVRPPVEKQIEYIEVEKVRERVRVVTKVLERPDGTTETVIVEESETEREWDQRHKELTKPVKKDWIVGTMIDFNGTSQRYGIHAARHQLLGFYLGGYVMVENNLTNPTYGVSLSYSF